MLVIREYLEEVFFHDLVQSSTGFHNDPRYSADPNPVLETEGTERFTCKRNKVTTEYRAILYKITFAESIISLADPPVAKKRMVTARRSLGDIARLICVCCLVMRGLTIPSRTLNSSAVIRSSVLKPV